MRKTRPLIGACIILMAAIMSMGMTGVVVETPDAASTDATLPRGDKGKIVGRVLDAETGEPMPGVNVLLVGTLLGASTDLDGDFLILNIPPKTYTLRASMIGFQPQVVEGLVVRADLTTRVADIRLGTQVFELGDEVVIVANREMIIKDMTATQAVIGADEIAALPVEEFLDVVQLQAGVNQGRDGSLHIRGGRSEEILYMVDGVPMSDVFSGDISVEVENSSIQELQVISGTFNAEYGRAMSGVVNIITKEGESELGGSLTLYGGDYLSSESAIFSRISDFDPLAVVNGQFALDGPVPGTGKKLRFFLTGRILSDDGYIFGERRFNPSDLSDFSADDTTKWAIQATGDGSIIPMRPLKKRTLHGKLNYNLRPGLKLIGSVMLNTIETRDWSQEGKSFTQENQARNFNRFRLNPDGASRQFQDGYTVVTTLDHLLTSTTFYNLNLSLQYNKASSYVFEDPFDARNQDRSFLQNVSDNAFFTGGTDPWYSERSTTTYAAKFDITSQVTKAHQLKGGLEFRSHRLDFSEFKLVPARNADGIEISPFQPALPPSISPFNNSYTHNPFEIAAYVQDKIELDEMIVNIGLRYDRFSPNAPVPTDPGDPRDPSKRRDATAKGLISPRLGLAFPISERGVLHFSYGFFFQMPLFQYLYANSEFEVEIGRLRTLMGNADLNPQKTIIYEVGLQQQITDGLAFDFTVYYKDIRELLGTQIYELSIGLDRYARYENRDFGNIRGFVVALNQRYATWMSSSVDYTYQVAEGNASEPNASFIDSQANRESEKRMVPLDWDQRHTLNAALTFFPVDRARITFLGRYGSGLPYTPSFLNIRRAFENTARSPSTLSVDVKADYDVQFSGVRYSFFVKVFNLFDARNEQIVFSDTGRSGFTIQSQLTGRVRGVNSVEDFFNRPDYYSPPRQVRMGFTLSF